MDYIQNLKDSVKLWWEHKYLWLLGMIVAFFSGGSNFRNDFDSSSDFPGKVEHGFDQATQQLDPIVQSIKSIPEELWIVIGAICISLLIIWILISIYIKNKAKSGLVKATEKITNGSKLNFKKSWNLGNKYWLKVFGQNVLLALPIIIVVLIIFGSMISIFYTNRDISFDESSFPIILSLIVILLCAVLGLYSIFIGCIKPFALRKLIIEDQSVIASINQGMRYFIKNFTEILITFLLKLVITILTFLVLALPFLALFLLFFMVFILGFVSLIMFNIIAALIYAFLLLVIFTLFSAAIQGPFVTFHELYWTLTYLRINDYKNKSVSKGEVKLTEI
ncbi:hypothetical protein GF362_00730 [Candidatus Dojkabacteria bacterium]|nr:hypothetical protein [Candidatus Dojkabacteria bacterium]